MTKHPMVEEMLAIKGYNTSLEEGYIINECVKIALKHLPLPEQSDEWSKAYLHVISEAHDAPAAFRLGWQAGRASCLQSKDDPAT
jgi:hypothetical protein